MPRELKSYSPTWQGHLLLACRKCQKRLKGDHGMRALFKLRKTIKRHNKDHHGAELHVIGVPCMNLCPKRAVTICFPDTQPTMLSLLRTEADVDKLYRAMPSG